MKRFLPLFALFLAPHFALAQTAPPRAVCRRAVCRPQKPPLPDARDLLDHLYAPYEAAKTFRGTFDIVIEGNDPKVELSEAHFQTLFRFDAKGNFAGENTSVRLVSRPDLKQRQTARFVSDGHVAKDVFVDQKMWSLNSPDDTSSQPLLMGTLLKPLLEKISQQLDETSGYEPTISRGVEAGRPTFVLGIKGTNDLRVVVDAQTRALLSFDLADGFSIRGSNQSFDEPIGEEELTWTPPADYKEVAEGEVALPTFFRDMTDKQKPAAAKSPATPTQN